MMREPLRKAAPSSRALSHSLSLIRQLSHYLSCGCEVSREQLQLGTIKAKCNNQDNEFDTRNLSIHSRRRRRCRFSLVDSLALVLA